MHSITEASVQSFNRTNHSAFMFKYKSVIVAHFDTALCDVCPDFISESGKLFKPCRVQNAAKFLRPFWKARGQNYTKTESGCHFSTHHSGWYQYRDEGKSNFVVMYCRTQYFSIISIHNILTR